MQAKARKSILASKSGSENDFSSKTEPRKRF